MKYTYTVYILQIIIICWFRLISLYNCRSRSQEAAPSLRGRNTPGIEGIPDLTAEQLTCSGSGAMPQAPVAEQKMCWVQPKKMMKDWVTENHSTRVNQTLCLFRLVLEEKSWPTPTRSMWWAWMEIQELSIWRCCRNPSAIASMHKLVVRLNVDASLLPRPLAHSKRSAMVPTSRTLMVKSLSKMMRLVTWTRFVCMCDLQNPVLRCLKLLQFRKFHVKWTCRIRVERFQRFAKWSFSQVAWVATSTWCTIALIRTAFYSVYYRATSPSRPNFSDQHLMSWQMNWVR